MRAQLPKARARVRRRAHETRRRRARDRPGARAARVDRGGRDGHVGAREAGARAARHPRAREEARGRARGPRRGRARHMAGAVWRVRGRGGATKRRFAGGFGRRRDERCDARRARRGAEGALDGSGRAPRPGPRARAAETTRGRGRTRRRLLAPAASARAATTRASRDESAAFDSTTLRSRFFSSAYRVFSFPTSRLSRRPSPFSRLGRVSRHASSIGSLPSGGRVRLASQVGHRSSLTAAFTCQGSAMWRSSAATAGLEVVRLRLSMTLHASIARRPCLLLPLARLKVLAPSRSPRRVNAPRG